MSYLNLLPWGAQLEEQEESGLQARPTSTKALQCLMEVRGYNATNRR